jgi:ComF family protein
MLEMPQTSYHSERENSLQQRLSLRIPVVHALALFKFSKNGRVQHLLHALKYKNHPEIGVALGQLYGQKMLETGYYSNLELIIPVPLHPIRKRKRGYNQSEKFGFGLAKALGIPCIDDVMERRMVTETQTLKTKLNRWENMMGAFRLRQPQQITNRNVLLVDDVITTGATLEACATVLQAGGCRGVSIACIAEA